MITLYLVRHGETVYNLENRIQGHSDSPLTPLGVRQVKAVAGRLAGEKISAIYSSDLGRAVATAEAIAQPHGLAVMQTDLLREAYHGLVQGMTLAEFQSAYPEEFRLWRENSALHRPPGAETLEDVIKRCGVFLDHVRERHSDGEIIAAAVHGGSLRGVLCAALGQSVSFYRSLHSANASLSIVELGERPSLRLLNDTCHLHTIEITEEDADNVPH